MTAYATPSELEAGLDDVRAAPREEGTLELIVVRPVVDEREVLDEAAARRRRRASSAIAGSRAGAPAGGPRTRRRR